MHLPSMWLEAAVRGRCSTSVFWWCYNTMRLYNLYITPPTLNPQQHTAHLAPIPLPLTAHLTSSLYPLTFTAHLSINLHPSISHCSLHLQPSSQLAHLGITLNCSHPSLPLSVFLSYFITLRYPLVNLVDLKSSAVFLHCDVYSVITAIWILGLSD